MGYINRKLREIPFFRKAIYLLVLWYACESQIPMPDRQGFTVPALEKICLKFLRLQYFERTKVAYVVLDNFVDNRFARSKTEEGRTFYSITDDGMARARAVIEEFSRAMKIDNEIVKEHPELELKSKMAVVDPLQMYMSVQAFDKHKVSGSPQEKLMGHYKRIVDELKITEQEAGRIT